jgi:hypothetical protein
MKPKVSLPFCKIPLISRSCATIRNKSSFFLQSWRPPPPLSAVTDWFFPLWLQSLLISGGYILVTQTRWRSMLWWQTNLTWIQGYKKVAPKIPFEAEKRELPEITQNKQTNSVALSPRVNHTDWSTATCRRNLVPTFCGYMDAAWSARRIPHGR